MSGNNSNCGVLHYTEGESKASSDRPDGAERNSQVIAASTNRVSESKNWDQTMSGINLAPSETYSIIINVGGILLEIPLQSYMCIFYH